MLLSRPQMVTALGEVGLPLAWADEVAQAGAADPIHFDGCAPRATAYPAQDVAAAGGWRSLQVMRDAYQHVAARGMMPVVESPRTGV